MSFSTLAIIIGLGFALPQIQGLRSPHDFKKSLNSFPRSVPTGVFLMFIGTAWFLWNLNNERISDFAAYKNMMFVGFAGIGVATCVFIRDFLAARGLAIVLLLLAKQVVDSGRWIESDWRLVLVTWAYLWVIAGMWITISPWRLRDWIGWMTATPERIKYGCIARLAFGLLVAALGLFAFK